MAVLQTSGNRPGAGATSLATALLALALRQGKKAAYYKPFSTDPEHDADIAFVNSRLAEAWDLPKAPTPSLLPQGPVDDSTLEAVKEQISHLQWAAEVIVLDGVAASLAGPLGATLLSVHGYTPGEDAASIAQAVGSVDGTPAGILVNAVPVYRREALATELSSRSLAGLAVLPESRSMLAVTVDQIAAHLCAKWVLEPINGDAPVERLLIGGNLMDAGPYYFGRFANQAVITRVQRPDIQMASFCEGTKCLVLTGPGEATEYIKAEAFERDIPLLQVSTSTMATADALGGLLDNASAHSLAKAQHFADLLTRYAAPDTLDSWLS